MRSIFLLIGRRRLGNGSCCKNRSPLKTHWRRAASERGGLNYSSQDLWSACYCTQPSVAIIESMKKEPETKKDGKEFERFKDFTRKLVAVPKEEIKRREQAAKAKKEAKVTRSQKRAT